MSALFENSSVILIFKEASKLVAEVGKNRGCQFLYPLEWYFFLICFLSQMKPLWWIQKSLETGPKWRCFWTTVHWELGKPAVCYWWCAGGHGWHEGRADRQGGWGGESRGAWRWGRGGAREGAGLKVEVEDRLCSSSPGSTRVALLLCLVHAIAKFCA